MKKLGFLLSLLLTQVSFAQWGQGNGDNPMGGLFPMGDSIVVVNDSTFVLGEDTIVISGTNPWGGNGNNDNPWGNNDQDNDNPWSDDSTDWDWSWGDDSMDWDWSDEMITDCEGNEVIAAWVGDGYCDDGAWGAYLNCEEFDFDGGDCDDIDEDWGGEWPWDNDTTDWGGNDSEWPWDMDTTDWDGNFPCDNDSTDWDWSDEMTTDCEGNEVIAAWVGDGYCDDGAWGAYLNCEEFDFDGGDCDDIDEDWGGEWPWDNDTTDWGGNDGEWPWDMDTTDWDGNFPWGNDSTDVSDEMITDCEGNEVIAAWVGDGYCDDGAWGAYLNCEEFDFDGGDCDDIDEDWGGEWPWDNDTTDWGGNDDEWPWDMDTTDWDGNWPGGNDGEWPWGNNNDDDTWGGCEGGDAFSGFEGIFDGVSFEENQVILVMEDMGIDLSILDENGIEYTSSDVDGYLVFGPFDLDALYAILIDGLEGLDLGWGLLRPTGELVEEGVITAAQGTLGGIFELSSMLSINDLNQELEVYSTKYYDLSGREVLNPNNGIFIQVKETNKGLMNQKVYIKK